MRGPYYSFPANPIDSLAYRVIESIDRVAFHRVQPGPFRNYFRTPCDNGNMYSRVRVIILSHRRNSCLGTLIASCSYYAEEIKKSVRPYRVERQPFFPSRSRILDRVAIIDAIVRISDRFVRLRESQGASLQQVSFMFKQRRSCKRK